MKFTKTFITIMFGASAAIAPAFAQDEEGPHAQEITVQALGSFVTSTTQNGVRQGASDSGGILTNYRFFFNQHNGVEIDYGYAANSQFYGTGGSQGDFGTNTHEFSASYVLRAKSRKITPFALAGVGALVFDPEGFTQGATTQSRAAFVYGAGADIRMSKHYFLRAQYRGFVYDSPTYGIPALSGEDRITHRAEPSIGFGVRF